MIVVVDASVLVAEIVRGRVWEFARLPRLRLVVTEAQWSEAQHEIARRLRIREERGHFTADRLLWIRQEVQSLIHERAIEVAPAETYHQFEAKARRRIPRDPNNWPTVALTIALNAGILTNDYDFFGCGCPTWTVETLRAELADVSFPRPASPRRTRRRSSPSRPSC